MSELAKVLRCGVVIGILPAEKMDHQYIEENNIADRYLIGQLSAEEQRRFEEHFLGCQQCRSQLETTHHFRIGLRSALASGEAKSRSYLQSDTAGQTRLTNLAFQAAAALLLVSLLAWLFLEWRRSRSDLTQARQVALAWQRKYEEGEQARKGLLTEIQARDRQLTAQQVQPAARFGREQRARALEADRRNRAPRRQDTVSVFALSMARGGNPSLVEPTNQITLSPRSELVIFLLELVADPDLRSYSATISTSDNQKVWHKSNLKPGSNNLLTLFFDSSLLKSGRSYLLTLDGISAQANSVEIARYTFSVLGR
jgi:hypothetical protein